MKLDACPVEPPGLGSGPFLDEDEVLPTESGEMSDETVADDPSADHYDVGLGGKFAHGWDSILKSIVVPVVPLRSAARSLRYNPRRQYWDDRSVCTRSGVPRLAFFGAFA